MLKNLNADFVRMEFPNKSDYWAVALNANKYQDGINHRTDFFVPYIESDKEYLEEHGMTDFIAVIVDIYKVSGIIKNDNNKTEESGKN